MVLKREGGGEGGNDTLQDEGRIRLMTISTATKI